MAVTTKIELTNQSFTANVSNALSPEVNKILIAAFAVMKLNSAQQINRSAFGYDPKYQTTVDGREGASLLSVNPDGGEIVFDFEIFSETVRSAIEAALDALRGVSPVVSGAYRDGHTLYVNDEPKSEIPQTLKPDDRIMISNPVIYSRRLEIGKTKSGRDFVIQQPNRIYERVAKNVLAPRFGNQLKITFEYVTLPDAGIVTGKMQARTPRYGIGGGKMRKRHHIVGSQVQSPAIIIEPLG